MKGVSIVIPTFNRPELLDILLKSIAQQTFRHFEVIVVDDCSSLEHDYLKIIGKYREVFDIKYLRNEQSKGAPFSRNKGINISRFDLVALVDDDDEWFPEKLEKQVDMFTRGSDELGIVYTWTLVVDKNKNVLREEKSEIEGIAQSEILSGCFIPSPSVMVKKEALVNSGFFDESFPSCQDWDTWTRVIFNGYQVRVVKEFLTYYLKHDGPTIGTSPRAKQGFIKYYKKHFWKLVSHGKVRHLIRLFRLSFGV